MGNANKLLEAIDDSFERSPANDSAMIDLSRRDAKEVVGYIAQLQIRCSEFATALFDVDPDHPLVRNVK